MKSASIFTNDFNRVIEATKNFVSNHEKHEKTVLQYIRLEFSAVTNIELLEVR